MPNLSKRYPAKLLLFGEYTVTMGSSALAIPYSHYGGQWQIGSQGPDHNLQKLIDHIENIPSLREYIDVKSFQADVNDHLIFDSNIPMGYGLGSSGALVAAVFDQYGIKSEFSLEELKNILGNLECAFHGISSGIDPLVSYLNSGILIKDKHEIQRLPVFEMDLGFFLIDTGIERQTSPLVDKFRWMVEENVTFKIKMDKLAKLNNDAIEAYLSHNTDKLWSTMYEISTLQCECMSWAIPLAYQQTWQDGLKNETYFLKLCGAGGGGMILGISKSKNGLSKLSEKYKVLGLDLM